MRDSTLLLEIDLRVARLKEEVAVLRGTKDGLQQEIQELESQREELIREMAANPRERLRL